MSRGNRGIKQVHKLTIRLGISITTLGVFVLVFGVTVVIESRVDLVLPHWVNDTGNGVWSGLWILVTGIICIIAGTRRYRYLINLNLAFSIISSILCGINMIFLSVTISHYGGYIDDFSIPACQRYSSFGSKKGTHYDADCQMQAQRKARILTAMYILILIGMILNIVLATVLSSLSCRIVKTYCCNGIRPLEMYMYQGGRSKATFKPVIINDLKSQQAKSHYILQTGDFYSKQLFEKNEKPSSRPIATLFSATNQQNATQLQLPTKKL